MVFQLHLTDKEAFYFSLFYFFLQKCNGISFAAVFTFTHTFSSSKIKGKYFFETCKQCLCLMAGTAHHPLCIYTAHLNCCHLLQLQSVSWHISLGLGKVKHPGSRFNLWLLLEQSSNW